MDKVTVPRGLLIGLGAALVLALLAVAFMMGRESRQSTEVVVVPAASAAASPIAAASAAAAPAASAAAAPAASAPASSPPPPAAPPPVEAPPPLPAPTGPRVVVRAPAVEPHPHPAAAPARNVPGHEEVAAYFRQMDNLQPGRLADDPNAFATEVLNSAMNGDTAGIDHLIQDAERSERQARALRPPPACRHYHAGALELMGESRQMMVGLRQSMQKNDPGAVTDMGTRAAALKSRVEALDDEERALKRKFGIPELSAP